MSKKTSALLFFAVLIAIDQLSKFIIRHSGGFYICNTGVAFGVEIPLILVYMLCLLFVLFIWKFGNWKLIKNWKLEIGNSEIILIISGSASNLIDRIAFGCVIDFINIRFWPVFNLADVFICLGAIILLAKSVKNK